MAKVAGEQSGLTLSVDPPEHEVVKGSSNPAKAANPLERISKANGPDDTHLVRSNTPKPVNNRTEYFRVYMRQYRARLKAARNSVNTNASSTV